MKISDYQNEVHKHFLVEWRIVNDDERARKGYPNHYHVYRIVEHPIRSGVQVFEFLTRNGQVDNQCWNGWFSDFGEIGTAFIKNQALTDREDYYTKGYQAYLQGDV